MTDAGMSVIKWQGDGTVSQGDDWWLSLQHRNLTSHRVVFRADVYRWGLSKSVSSASLAAVCEIAVLEAHRIGRNDRDFTYGTNITDPRLAPHGPMFILHPANLVVVPDSRSTTDGEHLTISVECFADGIPAPTYRMLQTRENGTVVTITTNYDPRYTLTGGRLSIVHPVEALDGGMYQCEASNVFGTVYSDLANITFGVLEQFPNVPRAPIVVLEYQSAAIECDPPQFRPAVTYQWYRGTVADFVRPELNPHMFISSNGKLYFSEVTQTDEADYNCIVKLSPGKDPMSTTQPPSRISLPIPLKIGGSEPAMWGPEIADGFIASFPNKPLVGDAVKLECLAYGTLPLIYSWSRKDKSLPEGAIQTDHNRVLTLPDVSLDDAGTYHCTVSRTTGNTAVAVHHLVIETRPYFISPLPNTHADVGSRLTWRCEAKAIPRAVYMWYKDGHPLFPVPGDLHVSTNVLTIMSVDAARHGGMYQCVALNTHGVSYSGAQLRVLAFKPTFAKDPLQESISAAIGSQVRLDCSPEAAPKPEFSWSRNGVDLNAVPDDGSSRLRLMADGDLLLAEVVAADAGQYCCTAANSLGTDNSCGTLTVVQNTVLTTKPTNTFGRVNATSVLMCSASFPGGADSIYMWSFNDRLIDTKRQKQYTIGTPQSPGTLYITNAQYHYAGTYTCSAWTPHGAVNASAVYIVEGPPGPPAGVFVADGGVSNSTVTLVWTEGAKHGPDVDIHHIEACTEHNHTWVVIAAGIPAAGTIWEGGDRRHLYHVTNLKPGNGYYFRVRGANGLGVGQPSLSSTMYRIPGAPPIIYPREVGGGGGVVGLLTITWQPLPPEDQGSGGVGYRVFWRLANTTRYSEVNLTENIGQYVVTVGLDNFWLLYEVKVAAFNNLGQGPISPDRVFIYSAEDIPKGAVTNVYAWPYNSTAIQVTWDIVPNIRQFMGGTLLGYQVNYKFRDDPDAGWDAISWRGETSYGIVIGLDVYTWYSVDMQVLNTAAMGPRSEIYHARTFKDAPKLYPQEVWVYSHSGSSVRLKWRGVNTQTGEENIEGYVVRYWQTTDDIRSATDVRTERVETEVVIYGIQKDTVYECRVFAFSRGGDGQHSETRYFTLGGLIPFDPSITDVMAAASAVVPNLTLCLLACLLFHFYRHFN
ncbi:contactin-like isoform X2 [Mya arenaria]|nr:contactin-like isoform X2 [Mya arenaria]XP_052806195.1 contactin-like isoform X2 [Mya arenaria]